MRQLAGTGYDGVRSPPRGPLPLAAVIGVGAVAGLITLLLVLLLGDDEDFSGQRIAGDSGRAPVSRIPLQAASESQLRSIAASADTPIYWAGARPGYTNEVTRSPDGRVFIRYLPPGVRIGASELTYRFVATFPNARAFAIVRRATKARGAITREVAGGGLAVANRRNPEIVRATALPLPSPPLFFARPRSKVLVEVFDTPLKRALRLVASGQVRPIPSR